MDDTDRLRDAWDAAEEAVATAGDPADLPELEARAEAAHDAYIEAEEALALARRIHSGKTRE